MNFILAALGIITYVILLRLAIKVVPIMYSFWRFCEKMYFQLGNAIASICFPLIYVLKKIDRKIELSNKLKKVFCRKSVFELFSYRFPVFGTARAVFGGFVSIFLCVILALICVKNGNYDVLSNVIDMLPVRFFVNLFDDFDFSVVNFLYMGITAALIGAVTDYLYGDYKLESFVSVIVSLFQYISAVIISCCLSFLISDVCNWIAKFGFGLYEKTKYNISNPDSGILSVPVLIFNIIVLIVLFYMGSIVVLTALRDCLDSICYALVGLGVFICAALFFAAFGEFFVPKFYDSVACAIIENVLLVICFVGFDFLRVNKEKLLLNKINVYDDDYDDYDDDFYDD